MNARNDHADVDLFIRLDQVGTVLGLLTVAVANGFFFRSNGVWLIVPLLLVLSVCLVAARGALREHALIRALAFTAAGNWIVAIGAPIVIPFIWPVMILTVLMPLVLATPHLSRNQVAPGIVATALMSAVVAAIGLLNDDGGAIRDIDDVVELVVVSCSVVFQIVPIGLVAWQHNQLQRSNVETLQHLNEELQISETALEMSRDRVVRAADNERRRIERDLHDGAQQRLVALGVRLRLLKSQTQDDPAVAESLEVVIHELDGAIEEVRELAHGIYPPLLQTRGLPDAITAVVRRSPLNIRTDIDDLDRFAEPVETALYFSALEALTNAAKHAPDAEVHLRLGVQADQLVLDVTDDGPGFDLPTAHHSHGFNNMTDRLAVVGGELAVRAKKGKGTTVIASVPTMTPGP